MKNSFSLNGMMQNLILAAMLDHAYKGDEIGFIQASGQADLAAALDYYTERRARFIRLFPDAVFMYPSRDMLAQMVNIWESPLAKAVLRELDAMAAFDAAHKASVSPESDDDSDTMPALFADFIENDLDLSALDSPAPAAPQLRENGRALYSSKGITKECLILKIHDKRATVLFQNKYTNNRRAVSLSSLTPID